MKRPATPPPPAASNSGVWLKRIGIAIVIALVLLRLISRVLR
jgi:hypothetical protein